MSDEVADLLEAGDRCGAGEAAVRLRDAVTAAINDGKLPQAYLEELSGAANELQFQVPLCAEEPAPPDDREDEEEQEDEEDNERQKEKKDKDRKDKGDDEKDDEQEDDEEDTEDDPQPTVPELPEVTTAEDEPIPTITETLP
jgi:hypothetical protein